MKNTKACSGCKQNKPLQDFAKHASTKSGLQSRCRTCIADDRQRYKLSKPNSAKESNAKYRNKFPERRRITNLKYRTQNSEKEKRRKRTYARENPEKIRMAAARRRAKLKGVASFKISQKDLNALKSRSCFYCGGIATHIDHVVPISRGGQHSIGNLVPACAFCNISKNDRFIMEWKMSEVYAKMRMQTRKENNANLLRR